MSTEDDVDNDIVRKLHKALVGEPLAECVTVLTCALELIVDLDVSDPRLHDDLKARIGQLRDNLVLALDSE